ncbi:MAG TPA: thioester reductase domain-containing protein [Candidatus Competibacter sp.]|nr:thioester reductase domain-containing protein [Candidatus Competibacter sp.]
MSVVELPFQTFAGERKAALHEKRARWKAAARGDRSGTRIALMATFSVHPLEPYLGYALEAAGRSTALFTSPFDQIVQEVLDEDSQTRRFAPDICLIWPRLEDLWRGRPLPGVAGGDFDSALLELAGLVAARAAGDRRFIFVLPAIPPARPLGLGDSCSCRGVYATAVRAREAARARLAGLPHVALLDFEEVIRALGEEQVYDWRLVSLARIPYTEAVFDEVGARLARLIPLIGSTVVPRLIALEPDAVLWDGWLEEAGPDGVNLAQGDAGEPHLAFQDFLADVRRAGHRLAVCSRRRAASLEAAFARREMRLSRGDFDAFLADQSDLVAGLRTLLQTTGTTETDLVFLAGETVDDFRTLAEAFPQARVLGLQEEPAKWPLVLERQGWIDAIPAPAEGEEPETIQRGETAPVTLEDFRKKLNLQVDIEPVGAADSNRLAHLGETVTEFNFTGESFAVARLEQEIASGAREFLGIRVSDRFGDYGVAGAVALTTADDALSVDAFLLNCRVLGRDVEWIVLDRLCSIARERRLKRVRLRYRTTPRNHVARDFLDRFAPDACSKDTEAFDVELDVEAFAARASARGRDPQIARSIPNAEPARTPGLELLRARRRKLPAAHAFRVGIELTQDLRTPAQALWAVQQEKQAARPVLETVYVEPRTLLERQLAHIWSRVLGIDQVGAFDNFFHIGGQSILATQLIFELEKTFGIELPVRVFFENPTVALMAHTIEAIQSARDAAEFNADAVSAALWVAGTQLRKEVDLDPTIAVNTSLPAGNALRPAAILLTGATGFLGAFLLRELLERTEATIYCHCRATDSAGALERLRGNVATYYPWPESQAARIVPVVGDLGKPGLGMEPALWQRLCAEIDLVVHNGAVTNFIDPYAKLKAANVLGTREILRFCCEAKTKPLHHVSTLYVFAPSDGTGGRALLEDSDPDHPEELHVGYRQSKWVAERLVKMGQSRGLPVTVYRLGRLSGCSATGACHTHDFLWRMIRAGVEAGCVMDNRIAMDMAPVDHVAKCLLHLIFNPRAQGKTHHLYNAQAPDLRTVGNWIRAFGLPLTEMSYAGWRKAIMERARTDPQSASAGLIAFLPQTIAQWDDLVFDQTNALAGLADSPLSIPRIDEAVFHRYLRYFTETGFFPVRIS